jgi:serine/threonine-protein kinase HipA
LQIALARETRFDNLVAEGWLRNAQARALGVNRENRFAMLLAFGRDCAGAVSIVDPEPVKNIKLDANDPEPFAALASRASLSGIQPKLLVIKQGRGYRPASAGDISTHIAKLPSGQLPSIIEIEWFSTEAARALIPGEPVVDLEIVPLGKVAPKALMIRRFDRTPSGRKLHFEEFNQLFGHPSDDKYDDSYEQMAEFIRTTPSCIPVEAERLFQRRGTSLFRSRMR